MISLAIIQMMHIFPLRHNTDQDFQRTLQQQQQQAKQDIFFPAKAPPILRNVADWCFPLQSWLELQTNLPGVGPNESGWQDCGEQGKLDFPRNASFNAGTPYGFHNVLLMFLGRLVQ